MDFPEIVVILAVAFIFLGPEKMIEVAGKLGEFLRKVRETWDELRYQMYLESINRKIMEESKEVSEKDGELRTSQDAPDGASEGAKKQAD
ncbi:MAG: preprotein translocase subunit TatA [Aquificota bacterium]|nr:MAG: preprotein translocase subunit TatA [Aquificota bacterium]